MLLSGDATVFWATVEDVRARLARLNDDKSLDGFIIRFDRLLHELPSDFFVTELVPAIDTGDVEPRPLVVVRPGPRLNALAAALRALDLDVCAHGAPLSSASAGTSPP